MPSRAWLAESRKYWEAKAKRLQQAYDRVKDVVGAVDDPWDRHGGWPSRS